MRQDDLKKLNRLSRGLIYAVAACIACLLTLAASRLWSEVFKPPPFYFTQPVYAASKAHYCPGETVEWQSKLIVTHAPTLLVLARSVWSVNEQRTIKPDENPKYFVWTELETGKPVAPPIRYTLPDDLPPGHYEIRVGASSHNTEAQAYRVPFVVEEGCGPNSGAPLKGD